ncbi:exodeoxyribonuclease III [Synoicihabitans lomoniglobus]|uniref:Exodeoxyribonuclease III n=1 Tax=Synoicihabitans lomoniglobus TaxID=2909285 RepID=A0AAF0CM93_9BACT|nr:exodeoxyribonuclease III [Opitutaceae bacterium LMO-M01]WED63798.1 exodeoxyribonuclease III [Opitutaceae bacterium LMO-M01]
MKLVSWNVNGLRAVLKKDFLDYFTATSPDVLCLQETKCHPGDVAQVEWPAGYTAYFSAAVKKGYSGTVVFTKRPPLSVREGIEIEEHSLEGRALTVEFEDFYLVNVYVPNAQHELRRLDYRQRWDVDFCTYLQTLEKSKPVVFCGDLNVAHKEIDLARPKANVGNPGFTIEERAGFDRFITAGFVDTFREFEPGPGHYSWWTYRAGARGRNIGWRIDYFMTSAALRPRLKNAWISPEVMGSDHCPVGLELS